MGIWTSGLLNNWHFPSSRHCVGRESDDEQMFKSGPDPSPSKALIKKEGEAACSSVKFCSSFDHPGKTPVPWRWQCRTGIEQNTRSGSSLTLLRGLAVITRAVLLPRSSPGLPPGGPALQIDKKQEPGQGPLRAVHQSTTWVDTAQGLQFMGWRERERALI